LGLFELLAQLRHLVRGAIGGEQQRLGPTFQLEPATVTGGHAAEPAALELRRGGAVRSELDADPDPRALALDHDIGARRLAVGQGRVGLTDQQVQHALELALFARHFRAGARLHRDARVGCDLAQERCQIDAPAAHFRLRSQLQLAQARDRVVERVEAGLDRGGRADLVVGTGRRLRELRHAFAQLAGGSASLLSQEPAELLPGQSVRGQCGLVSCHDPMPGAMGETRSFPR
jgi:hypothetical protein